MSASALIGQLKVLSTMDIQNFQTGLRTLKGEVTSAIKSIGGFGKSLLGLNSVKAVGIAAIAAGFKGLESLNRLSADAQNIGVAASSLAVLEHAASRSSVEATALHAGLGRLLKTMGDARNGSSEAAKAFSDIGLSVEDLKGKSADELFAVVSQKLSEINDPALQASAGAKLLGKGFGELKPLVDRGADAVKNFSAEARAMGLVMTKDQEQRAEKANGAWDRFKAACEGATRQIGAALAPAFEGLFEIGTSLLQSLKLLTPVFTGLGYVIGFVGKAVASTISGIETLTSLLIGKLSKALGYFFPQFTKWGEEWEQAAKDANDNCRKIWEGVKEGQKPLDETTAAIHELKASLSGSWFGNFANDAKNAASSVGGFFKALVKGEEDYQKLKADYEKQIRQFGMTEREKQIDDVHRVGGTDELKALDYKLRAKEEEKKLADEVAKAEEERIKKSEQAEKEKQERIKQLLEETKTEEDKLFEKWQEIVKLYGEGAITAAEYDRLAAKYFQDKAELTNKNKDDEDKPDFKSFTAGKALLFGSQEAREALLRGATRGGAGSNPMLTVLKNSEKIEGKMEKHLAKLAKRNAVRVAI